MAMDSQKKSRLEAAGWRVGTVAEYFDLSQKEAELIESELRKRAAEDNELVRRFLGKVDKESSDGR